MIRRALFVGCAAALVALASCSDDPADGEFGAECSTDADCNGDFICFAFSSGNECTLACPADEADCPDGSSGCNDKDVCKTK